VDNIQAVEEINNKIVNELWFDFEIISYDGFTLKLGGSNHSLDVPNIKYDLEVIFSDVFFISRIGVGR